MLDDFSPSQRCYAPARLKISHCWRTLLWESVETAGQVLFCKHIVSLHVFHELHSRTCALLWVKPPSSLCSDPRSCPEGRSCSRRFFEAATEEPAYSTLAQNGMTSIAVPCRSGFSSSASQKLPNGYGKQWGRRQASQQPLQWPRRQKRASSQMPTCLTFLTLSSSRAWTRLSLVSRAGFTWAAWSVAFGWVEGGPNRVVAAQH